jgi:hypothetical protein
LRVQLLILQWKVWKEIYLCPAHLRSYLKYECLHSFFLVLEYCSGMNSDAYTYMFIISKHYSIWGLAAEIKLFHWSGKLVLCFVWLIVGYHFRLQTIGVGDQCCTQDSSRKKPRSVYGVDWNGTNPVLK